MVRSSGPGGPPPAGAPQTLAPEVLAPPAPAAWGRKAKLHRLTGGLVKPIPSAAELAHRAAVTAIRQATWTRAVNAVVAGGKGGTGRTVATMILAGTLAEIRGGFVAAVEATEAAGTLNARSEGKPTRGLGELLARADQISTAGQLGGYTAPQTSHADVIATVAERGELRGSDVLAVRRLLDSYYRITITDTGTNPHHAARRAAVASADAAVLPCLVSLDALTALESTLATLGPLAGSPDSPPRVVAVLGHDGGPEDPQVAAAVRGRLDHLVATGAVSAVVEVPFDPAIRRGGPITLDDLSLASRRAWTQASAALIGALNAAPTDDLDLGTRGPASIRSTP
jgi:MinD-like ATPase involved in chromosome partitioning or flagellar assembly